MGILEAIGAVIAAVVAAFFVGRRQGSKTTTETLKKRDDDNAEKIRDKAERARAADDLSTLDAIERLRKSGRLRRDE